ncbi:MULTISPECIES: alpha/beta fold hydrolase [unclassified Crossiella]|uniref:alpha/beta fold hydrolase n=1 Tax=unclassified Crossiella TaxID=2620835 RepID=UPI001FFF111D|nr:MULTISPECIES: alpha/beta hydrolase [unclassified Crossiella]MCK2243019.1 alpha/beta hydrolase [Crossiella sp. S99.2]MCK2256896.1 alpha/beta hydrolase [Crossiella sp. S99.1]
MSVPLPSGFTSRIVDADGVGIHTVTAGEGPPLLLLHGYPQTHLIWHEVAPRLAERFSVVLTDLRGYGDSDKPAPGPDNAEYGKRAMASDQLAVMRRLGFEQFAVAGHDRGGRVAHRLALDHPESVTRLAVLDIVPTRYTFTHADKHFGLGYYHWFFLAAGHGIPERLIGNDPEFWIRARMGARHHGGTPFAEAAIAEYVRCFRDPAAIAASCADYRAAASIDLVHDDAAARAGNRIQCPLLALWGEAGFVGRSYDVLAAWREYAEQVSGKGLPCDHYLPEEAPEDTAAALAAFFSQ